LGEPRISEKLHEMMISSEEAPRVKFENGVHYMHYKDIFNPGDTTDFTSDQTVVSKSELKLILENYNYFKP
jgi:UDP-glucose 4-epimerase